MYCNVSKGPTALTTPASVAMSWACAKAWSQRKSSVICSSFLLCGGVFLFMFLCLFPLNRKASVLER